MAIINFEENCPQYIEFTAPTVYSGNPPFSDRRQIFVQMLLILFFYQIFWSFLSFAMTLGTGQQSSLARLHLRRIEVAPGEQIGSDEMQVRAVNSWGN